MKWLLRNFLIFALIILNAGCSTFFGDSGIFRSRGKDYLTSGPIKPVDVPAGMEVTSLEELYDVPRVDVEDEFGDPLALGDYEVPRPRPFTADKSGIAVKIQSQLGERWIFLNASTSQVWPQTQSFLSNSGFEVVHSDANKGIIETGWMQFKNDPTSKSRFRIKIEKGIHPDTTEVHVRQVELPMVEELPANFSWPESSDSPEREKFIVDNLAQSLAANVDNKAASLMGQNVGGKDRVEYGSAHREPQLIVRLPWRRAYASLAAAVKSDAFHYWDQDGDSKVFYFDYASGSENKKGFFSKLAFWSGDDEEAEAASETAPHELQEILQNLADKAPVRRIFGDKPGVGFGDNLSSGRGYLFVVQTGMEDGEEVQSVVARDYRGRPLPSQLSKEMLRKLRNNLL